MPGITGASGEDQGLRGQHKGNAGDEPRGRRLGSCWNKV
jgi:hypothetical protein